MLLSPSLAILFFILNLTECAKILGMFFMPSVSHQQVYQPIWKELSLRGHQVTVLTPNPLNDSTLTNLTEIDMESTYEIIRREDMSKYMAKDRNSVTRIMSMFFVTESIVFEHLKAAEPLFQNPETKFDLIIAETYVPLVYVLGCWFNAPVVALSSVGLPLHMHDVVGNPTHPVISPDPNFMGDSNFYGRLSSFLHNLCYRLMYHLIFLPQQDKTAQKLWHECPFLGEVERNLSFILVNSNLILHPVRAKIPNMVGIEQIHINTKINKLPKDLRDYLDSSTQGVIYLSLGTNVRSVDLSPRTRGTIIETLSELPYNVLWKWENASLPDKPNNVITKKWFPQQDVLRHKNIKAFITQGGLQSMEEAVTNGVPMIGIPFFGDQPSNVMKMVSLGIGRSIDHVQMTKEELKEAILDVARNKKYRRNIRKLKNILPDQPMSALEKSIWWIEYVLRHKGARQLRSPAADLSWLEDYFADVIFVFLSALAVFFYFLLLCWRVVRIVTKC